MRKTKRIRLKGWEILNYYTPVLFLLIIPAFCIPEYYKIYISHTYHGIRAPVELFCVTMPFGILAGILFIILKRDLKFHEVEMGQNYEQFKEALDRTAKQLEWNITHCSHAYALAVSNRFLTETGTIITIIRTEKLLYINSRCNPSPYSNPVTLGTVNKYKSVFLKNLNDVKRGIPEAIVDKDDLPTREWTFKRIIIRLLLYPLCFFFLGFSLFFLLPNGQISMGGVLIFVSCTYLYSDLKFVLFKYRKTN